MNSICNTMALSACLLALARIGSDGIAWADEVTFSYELNAEAFGTIYNLQEDTPFNPGNALANLPNRELEGQLRPKFELSYDGFSASVEPRIGYRWRDLDNGDDNGTNNYLQAWSVKYQADDWATLAGRQLLLWGPSQFFSPSNPFFASNNQTNPFIEPAARDFVQFQWFGAPRWSVSAIANISEGRDLINYPLFKPIYALKVDYVGEEFATNVVLAARQGDPQLGLFGQWTVNDATLIYGDMAFRSASPGLYPRRDDNPVGWTFESEEDRGLHFEGLVGGSYTFPSGNTLHLEYRRYQDGYSSGQSNAYYRLARDASASLASSDPAEVAEATRLLGQAANPFLRSLNRNYLYGQYLMPDVIKDLDLNFLLSHNLDDGGTQFTSIFNYYLSDNWRLAGNFVFNIGSENTEYGRYIRNVYFIGLKYFF